MQTTTPLEKLKKSVLPVGQIATRKWFIERGISVHTLDNYVKSGKLKLLTKGVYTNPDTKLGWQPMAISLPQLLPSPLTIGGLFALSLHGMAQYTQPGMHQVVDFFSPVPCPRWVKTLSDQMDTISINWKTTKRLWREGWPEGVSWTESIWMETVPPMFLSSPEQAFLELLMAVPDTISFEHADQIIQGLTQLSPKKLSLLLRSCINIKVKRLFFWFADRHRYAWRDRLDVDDYNLGSGKRVIAKGGKLDKSYLITVPESLAEEEI
ncbi:MAG: hypothetical protein HOK67_13000 [Deltaproteobacteria bacterium]|nr:hypothetical protein [Deltaproteobacteria bacterium]MBT6500811.1 hypothetical protein [Deltaproteobacteria bacterium]